MNCDEYSEWSEIVAKVGVNEHRWHHATDCEVGAFSDAILGGELVIVFSYVTPLALQNSFICLWTSLGALLTRRSDNFCLQKFLVVFLN